MLFVPVFAFSLPALPAFADDNARANRLMVEAVGLVGAAEREPSAQERLRRPATSPPEPRCTRGGTEAA